MSLVVLFSGQGLQQWKHHHEILDLAERYNIRPLLETLFPELLSLTHEQWQNQYAENIFAQKFIYTLQYLRWQVLSEQLPTVDLMLGYSLGEVSAFCCSAHLSFVDGFNIVKQRAELMSQTSDKTARLLSVNGITFYELEHLLIQTQTEISIELSPVQWIIGGYLDDLEQLKLLLASVAGCQYKYIDVSIASHTSLMNEAVSSFAQSLQPYASKSLSVPIISAYQGQKEYRSQKEIEHLVYQINHSLNWYTALNVLQEHQPQLIIEIGCGNALTKMIQQQMNDVSVRAIDDFSNIDNSIQWIKNHMVDTY